ncbi:MAG: hypothetical protein WCA10_25990 [Terracidiphilus sp.]
MESKTCCAYNATRGCRINSTVTVTDSAREPLKVLKVLVEGLARDSKSSLWLTPLAHAPQLARIFPFDLAYLDQDMKVLEAMALQPETPAPRFRAGMASALILPFNCLQSSGTVPGDRIIVCAENELEHRIAEISRPAVAEPVTPVAEAPIAAKNPPVSPLPKLPPHPFPSRQVSAPPLAPTVTRGTGFTVGMTSSSWQISNSTMAASAVLEPVEVQQQEAVQEEEAESEKVGEIALAETERAEAGEERVTSGNVEASAFGAVSEAVSDTAAAAEVGENAVELAPAAAPAAAAELEGGAAEPKTVAVEPESIAAEPEAPEEKTGAVEASDQAEKPGPDVSRVPAETAQVAQARMQVDSHEIGRESPETKRKKAADSVPAKVPISTNAGPVTAKKKLQEEKKKESLGVLVKRFLNCEDPLPERRSIIRLLVQGLTAYAGDGETKKLYEVRDVSPTGLYLRTQERWQPGEVFSLVLQRKDATEAQRERRVTVDLKAVRCDEDGAGFEWLWPEGVELEAWKRVHTKRSDETDADYFLRELRLTRALGFLRQICPAAMEEMKLGLHKRLSNKRVASAVEITLKAQEMLGRLGPGGKVQAHPDMVRRVLENGSWTEDDWIRQWWGGLLVSSCGADAPDTSNSVFIDLLAKLTPVHLRVLSFVCRKATERIGAGEPAATLELYCTSEELIEAVGSHSLARIQQTMGQLSSLALLAESNKPSYVAVTDKVKTRATPTALALTMHGRCNGHR